MTDNKTRNGDPASFNITRKENIIEKLAYIQKLSVLLDVKPTAAAETSVITTHIAKILPGKNLFAIDITADAGLNLALQAGGELVFSTTVEGVAVRFNVSGVSPATLGGKPVFAAPIPQSLYWRERRRSYRMAIPVTKPITCTMLLPGLNLDKFPVLDISQTGFSLLDEHQLVVTELNVGHVFQGCTFSWPSTVKDPFSAKLCRTEMVGGNGTLRSFKLGLRFTQVTPAFDNGLKKLLHDLAQLKKDIR
jgi:flagellar brake protein